MFGTPAHNKQGDPPRSAVRVRSGAPRVAIAMICAVAMVGCSHPSTKATPAPRTGSTTATPDTSTPTPPTRTANSSSPPTATGTAPSPAGSGVATSSSAPNAPGTGTACTTAQLRLGTARSNGAGGTNYLTYPLTNTAATACTLLGYPGVSVIDASGAIVQQAARRYPTLTPTGAPTGVLTVAAHASVYFVVSVIDSDPDPQCPGVRTGTRLRVYPPNQTTALIQSGSSGYQACQMAVGRVFPK